METITLAAPIIVPQLTTTDFTITSIGLFWDRQHIEVAFRGTNGERRFWTVDGAPAVTYMKTLNTANLVLKSLHRRIMELAIADGVFAGTIAGTPDV